MEPVSSAHSEKDIRYHDLIASEYDRVVVEPRWTSIDALFGRATRFFPPGRAGMLDIGAGTGHMLRRFGRLFESVVAVDHSPAMLARARAMAERLGLAHVEFVTADADAFLARETRTFDLITCVGFLHHLEPSSLARTLRAARQRLADNGALMISEPIAGAHREPAPISWWNRAYRARPQVYENSPEDPDEAPLDLAQLRLAFDDAGLKVVGEGRGWEIFPRFESNSLADRMGVRTLHALFGGTGPVYWACCKSSD